MYRNLIQKYIYLGVGTEKFEGIGCIAWNLVDIISWIETYIGGYHNCM
jgi:hypothetical protein